MVSDFSFSQSALRHWWMKRGARLFMVGFMLQSARTISWSEMPGIAETFLTNVGLLVKNKSNKLDSLVGSLCNWVRSNCWLMFKTSSFTAFWLELERTVPSSQFMSPVLKSPESIKVVLGLFLCFSSIWYKAFSRFSTWQVRWSGCR